MMRREALEFGPKSEMLTGVLREISGLTRRGCVPRENLLPQLPQQLSRAENNMEFNLYTCT